MNESKAKACPIELAINLINKKWVILILRDMFFGASHFNEFKEGKPNLSNKVLSGCLKDMDANGLIVRTVNGDDSSDIEYKLTEKGLALNKVLYELAMFSLDTDINNVHYTDQDKKELKKTFENALLI